MWLRVCLCICLCMHVCMCNVYVCMSISFYICSLNTFIVHRPPFFLAYLSHLLLHSQFLFFEICVCWLNWYDRAKHIHLCVAVATAAAANIRPKICIAENLFLAKSKKVSTQNTRSLQMFKWYRISSWRYTRIQCAYVQCCPIENIIVINNHTIAMAIPHTPKPIYTILQLVFWDVNFECWDTVFFSLYPFFCLFDI